MTADRIAALGVPIRVAEGGEVMLRYSFAALRRCEEEFGNLGACSESLNGLWHAIQADYAAPVVGPLERHLIAVTGDDEIGDRVDQHPSELVTALALAWRQAWPEPGEEDPGTTGKAASRSRGGGSTGGRRSGSAAPTASSGG